MNEPPVITSPPGRDGTRTRRYVLVTILLLLLALLATQLFLHQTSVGSPRFVRMTLFLWTATVSVLLALLVLATVLGRNLIKLYFERRSGLVGSRFKTRMLRMFVALSLLPAILLFLLAYVLINASIEQWFSAPAAQMVDFSKSMLSQYYQELEERTRISAKEIASSVEAGEILSSGRRLTRELEELRLRHHLDRVRIYDRRGAPAGDSNTQSGSNEPDARILDLVHSALGGIPGFRVDRVSPGDALKEAVWATAPIRDRSGAIVGAVWTEAINPRSMRFKASSVEEAYGAYELLQREKAPLRFNFLLILALSTLLIVFAFSWFALYLAKRITVPIQALAEGAAEVAAGNLDHRVECEAFDELASLVSSFNRMTADLADNKKRIEAAQTTLLRTNVESDDRRRYIETILQTIATGVISLDGNYRIRTMNRAATQMLGVQQVPTEARIEEVVPGDAGETLRMLLLKSAILGPVLRNIELALPEKTLHLAATVTPLLDGAGNRTGWVVVLDDVSELLRAEKMAAWQEVARRLAHEIKNPLTPIQLSAERILRRYRQIQLSSEAIPASLSAEISSFDSLLNECVRAIVQEAASLKNLVDEFSRFARLPELKPEDSDIHQILENTLSLYNGRIHDVRLLLSLGKDLPRMRLDPEQMKRVFINLFDNALEAMAATSNPKILQIITASSAVQKSVHIEISDTGCGFPAEYRDSLFLPYFSTRKGGTGLGLAIVRQIISEHHGYVRAEPNEPLGTRIIIDLPVAAA